MKPSLHRAIICSLLVAASAAVLGQLLRWTPPTWVGAKWFASVPILFFARRTEARIWLLTGVIGAAVALWFRVIHHGTDVPWPVSMAFGLGSASILVAVAAAGAAADADRNAHWRTAAAISLFPVKLYLGILLLGATALLSPITYDGYLAAIDQSLGGNLSFTAGQFLLANPPLRFAAFLAYDTLPIAVMLAAALRWRRFGAGDQASIPLTAGVAAAIAVGLYLIVPAAGPLFVWGPLFPLHPPAVGSVTGLTAVDPQFWRNCMPSLHFTGALIVLWGTWSLGRGARLFGVAFLVLTALATLGTGQHYAVDLIVAVPYAIAIEMAVRRSPGWWRISAVGAGLTALWLVCMRIAPSLFLVPAITWAFVGLTVAGLAAVAVRADGSPLWIIRPRVTQIPA